MFQEQAPQVPRPDSEPLSQDLDSTVLQPTLADQPQSPRNRVRGPKPCRRTRRAFGTAPQTRAITRLRRRCGTSVVNDAALRERPHGANRTTIDFCTRHSDKKLAVESRVASQPRARTCLQIQVHIFFRQPMVTAPEEDSRRFRTTFVPSRNSGSPNLTQPNSGTTRSANVHSAALDLRMLPTSGCGFWQAR